MYGHCGIANRPFIKLPSNPLAAAEQNIKPMLKFSRRRPGSLIQLESTLFLKVVYTAPPLSETMPAGPPIS